MEVRRQVVARLAVFREQVLPDFADGHLSRSMDSEETPIVPD